MLHKNKNYGFDAQATRSPAGQYNSAFIGGILLDISCLGLQQHCRRHSSAMMQTAQFPDAASVRAFVGTSIVLATPK